MEQQIEFVTNHLEFVTNHPFLFGALVLVLILLAQNLLAGGGKLSIDPQRATEMINREEAVVVDVRPIADFTKGHIINAVNLPVNGLKSQLGRIEKHKDKPIIVTCRSGAQSTGACKQLRTAGFEKVYNLSGGIMAWQSANLPISLKK
ncbi:MAG: rhodanese-like domain-containing protein [Gammaproteobacteria bacterium]|nr:rhodanese-like domain-containing protein [Gammaproteobacteria bacterium]